MSLQADEGVSTLNATRKERRAQGRTERPVRGRRLMWNTEKERFRLLGHRQKLMMTDSTLKSVGLRLALAMSYDFNSDDGGYWKSLDNLAAELGCQKRRITEGRKILVDRGYLVPVEERRYGRKMTVYYPAIPEDASQAECDETPACDYDDGFPF